ncbi:MAG: hypothetical protein HKN13_08120, partial [Rhodothermales bacterium]|nr:hypothetical protein [Rhodothermales bacterium]
DLLIVVNVRDGQVIDPNSVELFIDDIEYTHEVKVSPKSIRFLFRDGTGRALRPGNHVARVIARLPDGTDLGNLEWQFTVNGVRKSPIAERRARPTLPIRGSTFIGTRNSDVSGNRGLRQEPESIYSIRSDLRAELGAFTFPLKAYLTTNESNTSQPRNRFLIGAQSKHLTVLLGDTNPYYSPLALSNTRTRGVMAEVYLRPIRLSFIRGQTRRGLELEQVGDPNTLATPLLSTYKRQMTAARLSIGGPKSARFSLHALKAQDDTLSTSFGTRPIENLVAGSDLEFNILKGRFGAAAGAAMSLTTEDISRGVSDKAEIDSLFDVDLPFDPSDFKHIITLNTSTVPIRLDKLNSLAWYSSAHAKAFGHSVKAEYRSIGGSFFSAGNPFLIGDRKIYSFSDRFRHADGRLFGILRYTQYSNFDDGSFTIPLSNKSMSANVTVAPRNEVPTITTGFRRQLRSRGTSELPLSDSELNSYTLGLTKQFTLGTKRHTIQILGTRSSRTDVVQPQLDNIALTSTIGLVDQLTRTLSTSVRYTRVGIRYVNLNDRQNFHTASGDISYQFESIPLNVDTGLRYTYTGGSSLVSSSNRYGFSVAGEYELQQNMLVELRVGLDAYRDQQFTEARYTERYVMLRHRYTF